MTRSEANERGRLGIGGMAACGVGAVAAFHAAYLAESLRFLIGLFLFFLILMARARTGRLAFYVGLAVGLAIYGPHLHFFFEIFRWAAVPLWLVLATWLAVFLALARRSRERYGDLGLAVVAPFLWTGLEYCRSELYYLKFSWLNVGFSFAGPGEGTGMLYWGVYGAGFLLMALAGLSCLLPRRLALSAGVLSLATVALVAAIPEASPGVNKGKGPFRPLKVAGIQAEFPVELEVPLLLDRLVLQHPRADLLVMSEYTFDGPVPRTTLSWCRKHARYLVVGGKEPGAAGQFTNTTYVVGPDGRIAFQQAKSVPIQFFQDGRPAVAQRLWDSPWGKLGFCVCYDLSYRRVVEGLARLGAQAIVVPTMDVAEWGRYEHLLHARVAPARAKEFGVPVIRLASSGISQWVQGTGQLKASAPFPGEHETVCGVFDLRQPVRFPLDYWLAPASVWVMLGYLCWDWTRRRPVGALANAV